MIGLEYNTAVSSLNTCNAPMLQVKYPDGLTISVLQIRILNDPELFIHYGFECGKYPGNVNLTDENLYLDTFGLSGPCGLGDVRCHI